ncbi:PLP-dependent aminotransferase family protein [Bordetella bronchiseptica]|uniref:aminotransferase-like domain-containing protein n=1 Tax=Bordetella bronchiseptica TaxID=518 RepID=UPI00052864E3|nr:PLP-dependent aminotransferase family protein [Bordetella bronchiseptica]AWP77832.1 2-aminoadipate aminotransferase [Bordetella bronchiseptica]SUV72127.1 aminotransferase [Bordetella bronchiseptica]VEI28413.1 aminotransferase [Bordetella bronchiseptica]
MDKPFEPECSFSERAKQLTSSAIREILKVTERPEVISFAGGLPAPGGFPVEVVQAAFDKVLATNGRAALQYGPTEGYAPLRQWVADDLNAAGANVTADQILIVSGSQQALDLLGKVLIDKDSPILVEDPSYLGALQSFSLYQPRYVPIPTDDGGLVPEAITAELAEGARFLYALPNFQNPTGRTLNLERRKALVRQAAQFGVPIIEDDPYGELRYAGEPQPGLLALAGECGATVIRLGTFSKVLAPGLRLGYIAAPRNIINKLVQAKQATDLHTPTLTQMAVYEVVKTGFLAEHLPRVREIYRVQGRCMLEAIEREFPASVSWTKPEGGMFIWVTLPEHIDSTKLLAQAVEQNVAFVPGGPFYAGTPRQNTLRLSFATVPEAKIREGIAILGKLLKAAI